MKHDEILQNYFPLWGGWTIDHPVGIGSYGKVYRISKKLGNDKIYSAVKHITIPTTAQYEDAMLSFGNNQEKMDLYFKDIVNKFENEVKLLYILRGNTNIVNYEDYLIKQREDFGWDILIKMEYVTPLHKFIEARDLTKEMIINLGIDLCNGLKLCHDNGIIHRDIKDSNIFISNNNHFKIGDFGVSTNLSSEEAVTRIGTPYYMAPEVILNVGNEKYDKSVDIYSLGIVLYRLFNKLKFPFVPLDDDKITYNAKQMAQAKRIKGNVLPRACDADDRLWKIIKKACEHSPKNRYSDVNDLKNDLMNVLGSMSEDEKNEVIIKATGISRNNPYFTKKDINKIKENKDEVKDIQVTNNEDEDIVTSNDEDTLLLGEDDSTILLEDETVLLEDDSTVLLEDEGTLLLEDVVRDEANDSNDKSKKKRIMLISSITCIVLLIALGLFKVVQNNKLPQVSDELGILPGNISSYSNDSGIMSPFMVQGNDKMTYYNSYYDVNTSSEDGSFYEQCTIDERRPSSFNKYGDSIFYIREDLNEVVEYNTVTNEEDYSSGIIAEQIIIMGDYIYYIDVDMESINYLGLSKMSLIDGSSENLIDKPISMFSLNSNYVVYRIYNESDIYIMNLKTNESSTLDIDSNKNEWIALYENCILYKKGTDLYRVNLKGNKVDVNSKKIIEENVYRFTLDGDYLYFIDDNYNLFAKNLRNKDTLLIDENVRYINVDNGMMYYMYDKYYSGLHVELGGNVVTRKFEPEDYK